MVDNPINEDLVRAEIAKLRPLNYNVFYWWRRYAPKNKPLPKGSSLWDMIINGDLDYSHYYWQAQYCELEIQEKFKNSIDTHSYLDATQIDRERRKKLWEDFEKDEREKLRLIKKLFIQTFYITSSQYEEEIEEFGDDLKSLYIHFKSRYGQKPITKPRRGRPRKNRL